MSKLDGKRTIVTSQLIEDVLKYRKTHTRDETCNHFQLSHGTISKICKGKIGTTAKEDVKVHKTPEIEQNFDSNSGNITVRSLDVKTLDDALRVGNVDLQMWEVDRYSINSWEVTMHDELDIPQTYTNWQVKVWLKRKATEVRSLELLLQEMEKKSVIVKYHAPKSKKATFERELEISIMDPHLGMRCFPPAADKEWSIETCTNMMMEMLTYLLKAAEMYGPFERIILPIGNDLYHADGVFHTTTQGTLQPEMDSWSHVYLAGEKLTLSEIDLCLQYAPVKVFSIMGNHDRQSIFTLGRVIQAYYHNDNRVEVDASSSPYKFHHFGVNLIGFEHGHSIRQTVRLAALMANECASVWGKTLYREWHLGDQHRKGSAKPCMMEEQGVSVEFLPGLTSVNEWHKIKAFSWQKRAGTAFVWDKKMGPIARLQTHISNVDGKIL